MAVNSSVGGLAARRFGLALLLDRRGIEQRGNDRRRTDPDRNAGLNQLGPPFFVAFVGIAHSILTLELGSRPYAEQRDMGSEVPCVAG